MQDSTRHLTTSTLNSPKGTSKEIAICTNSALSDPHKPPGVETPTSHTQDPVKSPSHLPVNTVETPSLQTTSSGVTDHALTIPVISDPLPPPSTEDLSDLQLSKPTVSISNSLSSNGLDCNHFGQELADSQSLIPFQGQMSRLNPKTDQPINTPPLTANNTDFEHNPGSQTVVVASGPSVVPVASAQIKSWQHAFCLLDSAITELLEIIPLTAVVPSSDTAFYKPNPYSPSFQWTPARVFTCIDPPGLSLTNIPPIVTFRPLEPCKPPAKPEHVPTPAPSRSSQLAPADVNSQQKTPSVLSLPPAAHDGVAHGQQPAHASTGQPFLSPAGSFAMVESTRSSPLTADNQESSLQPNSQPPSCQLPQNVPVEPAPVFNVTEAQKMKFVDTYRRVDAAGKAKLEATLRMNKLWDLLAPLLTKAASETPSTSMPQTIPLAPQPKVSAALTVTNPNLTTSSPASPANTSVHVPAGISQEPPVTCLSNFQPSDLRSKADPSQPPKVSLNPAFININGASSKEGTLDPILSKMISAMLAAEPQATPVLIAAFETLGIRNKELIMAHLHALAIPMRHDEDTLWQLRTATTPALFTTSLIDPSFLASHHHTPKSVGPMILSRPAPEVGPLSSDHSLPNGTTAPSVMEHPGHMSESPRRVQPPGPRCQAQSAPTQSTSKIDGGGEKLGDEIEIVHVADLRTGKEASGVADVESGRAASVGDVGSNHATPQGRGADGSTKQRETSGPRKPQAESRASPLGRTQTQLLRPQQQQQPLCFNLLRDGLPGFPDADPAVQVPGEPARILARFPPGQQMPPIRTFVPLLKKSTS